MIQKFSVALFVCAALWSCNSNKFPTDQLVGEWQCTIDKDIAGEKWEKASDGKLVSTAYFISVGVKQDFETVDWTMDGDSVSYTVRDINNASDQVEFKKRVEGKNFIEFHNREHDYPQVIRYEFINQDSLVATIGTYPLEMATEKLVFPYHRLK